MQPDIHRAKIMSASFEVMPVLLRSVLNLSAACKCCHGFGLNKDNLFLVMQRGTTGLIKSYTLKKVNQKVNPSR